MHLHQREARVAPLLRIERADPDQPMHAALALQAAVCPSAIDREGHALQARLLALGLVEDLGLEAGALGPAQVHAQQHLGPVLALGPAGSGMDRYDRRPLVVRLRQQQAAAPSAPSRPGERRGRARGRRPAPRPRVVVGLGQLAPSRRGASARCSRSRQAPISSRSSSARRSTACAAFGSSQRSGSPERVRQLGELGFLGGQVKGAPPYRPRGAPGAAPRP